MNFFDYVIIIVIALSTIGSFFRGFARELMSLIIWIVGIVLALKYSPLISPHLLLSLHSALMSYILAFALIFMAVWLVGLFISLAIRSLLDRVGLSLVDRLIGLLFGFARGVLLMAVVMLFVDASALSDSGVIKTSLFAPELRLLVDKFAHFIPDDLKKRISMGWKQDVDDVGDGG